MECLKKAAGNPAMDDADVELPSLVIDVSGSSWEIIGANTSWEQLTGLTRDDMLQYGGQSLWDVLAPRDLTELAALMALTEANEKPSAIAHNDQQHIDSNSEFNPTTATILCPTATSGSSLQLLVALRRSTGSVWTATVHGRAAGRRPEARLGLLSSSSFSTTSSLKYSNRAMMIPSGSSPSASASSDAPTRSNQPGGRTERGEPITNTPLHESDTPYAAPSSHSTTGSSASGVPPTLYIPPRLATLRIGDLLAKGSFGNVYTGFLKDSPVAIKVVECDSGKDGDVQAWDAQFEALLSLDLHHPHVVPTLDFCVHQAQAPLSSQSTDQKKSDRRSSFDMNREVRGNVQVWLVQPLCDQGTLGSAIAHNVLRVGRERDAEPDIPAVLDTAKDIASAMQYLHAKNMLHGDLSSNNVLLTSADTPRGFIAVINDFGLSRIAKNRDITTKTVGTVSHMAPELLMDGVMTGASDVYSFGVLLWEMCCGKKAWTGSSLAQVIYAVTCKGEKLSLEPEDAPPQLASLVTECMNDDRSARPSFDDIVIRLDSMKF